MMLLTWLPAMMDVIMVQELMLLFLDLVLEIIIFRVEVRLEPCEAFMLLFRPTKVQLLLLQLVENVREEVRFLADKDVLVFLDRREKTFRVHTVRDAERLAKLAGCVAIASCCHRLFQRLRPMDGARVHVTQVTAVETLYKINRARNLPCHLNFMNADHAGSVRMGNADEGVVRFGAKHELFAGHVKEKRVVLLPWLDFFLIKRPQVTERVEIENSMDAAMILRFYRRDNKLAFSKREGLLDAGNAVVIGYRHADVFVFALGEHGTDMRDGVHAVSGVKVHINRA